mgnify:CR=1 FL=1
MVTKDFPGWFDIVARTFVILAFVVGGFYIGMEWIHGGWNVPYWCAYASILFGTLAWAGSK